MKIKEVMTRAVEVVRPDNTVQEAAAKMKSRDVGPIPVVDGDRVVGIVTDRDIVVRSVADGRDSKTTRVQDVMTRDVASCGEEDDVKDAARTMKQRQIRRLVVLTADKRLAGILSLGDIAVDTRDDKMSGDVLEKVSQGGATAGKRG
jgi:CBS domain-containing protein